MGWKKSRRTLRVSGKKKTHEERAQDVHVDITLLPNAEGCRFPGPDAGERPPRTSPRSLRSLYFMHSCHHTFSTETTISLLIPGLGPCRAQWPTSFSPLKI